MSEFDDAMHTVEQLQTVAMTGTVMEVRGLTILVRDLPLPVGAVVRVNSHGQYRLGEVVGFDQEKTIVMLMGQTFGIRRGDRVIGEPSGAMAWVGHDMLGRVVDSMGRPIDGLGPIRDTVFRPLNPPPLDPMTRVPIAEPLGSGIRAIDGMLTIGRGQRLGIFAGPGVGKSTLLGMMAQKTDAHVSVIALIGERGRELRDFLDRSLGPEGLSRSVVVVSTGDDPALQRVRAALYATSVAEYFRDLGMDVILLMDSVTRFAQAQRQIGLAAGEPPATKGFTPTVFAMLPTLLERAGRTETGSITGLYAILVEGDDFTEPISDAAMGILDGHILLSRDLANKAHYPAIDVQGSVSRVANEVTDDQHRQARDLVRRMIAQYAEVEDLVNIGAYAGGSNPDFDLAIAMRPAITQFLQQGEHDEVTFTDARQKLLQLGMTIGHQSQQLQKSRAARSQAMQPPAGQNPARG